MGLTIHLVGTRLLWLNHTSSRYQVVRGSTIYLVGTGVCQGLKHTPCRYRVVRGRYQGVPGTEIYTL
jgi:hypothetical protein